MPPKRVALFIETSKAFGRGVLQGIGRWQRAHEPWRVYADERGFNEAIPRDLIAAEWDGVITRLQRNQMPPQWLDGSLPVVSLRWEEADVPSPGIHSDEKAIAHLAADHLLEHGFSGLAYCGVATRWSRLREEAFADRAASRGATVHVFDMLQASRTGMRPDDVPAIARWIESLPRPVGIMAAYDVRALEVLDAVRSLGLACPDDVAVIGVDNDDVLCDLATPPLSSVAQNLECIGYEAARALAARMDGRKAVTESVFVPPVGVAVRRSTDMLAVDDPDVRRALRLIRAKACDGLSADEVANATDLSRRSLDRQFAKLLSRSIHDEIVRTKLIAARRLLAESDLKLAAIAARCDFSHAAQFCNVFKKAFGITPTEYRRQCRPWA
jgi:LacI family transcriptional regulator